MKTVQVLGAITAAAALISFSTASAASDGLCVSCDGPAKTYLCSVKKAEQIEMLAGAKAINKICTKVIAKTGPHTKCHVTGDAGAQCPGTPKLIDWKTVKAALQAEADEEKAKSAAPVAETLPTEKNVQGPVQPEGSGGPAPEAPANRQETAEPAKKPNLADGISNAAEKTWDCVSSLFDKCL